jgi:hypothetical protein
MVMAELELAIFAMVIGLGSLYLAFRRQEKETATILWPVISAVIFIGMVLYSGTIPFSVDASGAVIGTSANIMLIGVNLIFFFISLIYSIHVAFQTLKA